MYHDYLFAECNFFNTNHISKCEKCSPGISYYRKLGKLD